MGGEGGMGVHGQGEWGNRRTWAGMKRTLLQALRTEVQAVGSALLCWELCVCVCVKGGT